MFRKYYKSRKDRTICWPFRSRVENGVKFGLILPRLLKFSETVFA